MREPLDPRTGYLNKLYTELHAKGVKCELVTTGCAPRLQLDIPWCPYGADDEFQDQVLVSSEPDGTWRFWWSYLQVIAPVDNMVEAVGHIYRNTIACFEPDGEDGTDAQDEPGQESADYELHLTGRVHP